MNSDSRPKCLSIFFIMTLFLTLSSLLIGCGGGGGGGGDDVDVTPEAEATIGPEGGTVEVTDNDSPLFGVKIEIPEGVVEKDTNFFVSLATENLQPPYENVSFGIGIKIDCDSSLQDFVIVTMPLNFEPTKEDLIVIANYNDANDVWSMLPYTDIDYVDKKIKFITNHFSYFFYVKTKVEDLPSNGSTNFDLKRDCFYSKNIDDTCSGMSNFATWYYKKYGHGLRCRWSQEKSRAVALQAQNAIKDTILGWVGSRLNFFNALGAISTLLVSLNEGNPQVLDLADYDYWPPGKTGIEGHAVVVVGYEKTNNLITLYCYDPNHPLDETKITVELNSSDEWEIHHPDWPNYSIYYPDNIWELVSYKFKDILDQDAYSPDDWCDNNKPTVTSKIPDTSQTISYTDTFGEDSDYIINPKSYTKLDDSGNELSDSATNWAMVRDHVTGLIWENKTDDDSIHDKDNSYPWLNARDIFIAELNAENFGGHNDWRLPTVKELSTLVHADSPYPGPTINITYFQNTQNSVYWSSTWSAESLSRWIVNFRGGNVNEEAEAYHHYVFAVRGLQTDNNLIDNGDGTVTDQQSGLMWQQSEAEGLTWEAALTYCEDLELAGYGDWRLPNRNELQSIVDYSQFYPSIDTVAFPGAIGSDNYWSSTTQADFPDHAWFVHFGYSGGGVGYRAKFYTNYVRAVRTAE